MEGKRKGRRNRQTGRGKKEWDKKREGRGMKKKEGFTQRKRGRGEDRGRNRGKGRTSCK